MDDMQKELYDSAMHSVRDYDLWGRQSSWPTILVVIAANVVVWPVLYLLQAFF